MSIHDHPKCSSAVRLNEIPNYDVKKLVGSGSLATIQLDEKIYTLRITRAGKLILTK